MLTEYMRYGIYMVVPYGSAQSLILFMPRRHIVLLFQTFFL